MSIKPSSFQKRLLHWFDTHGRQHLPWQENKTPYRVWVSEIMLQQTQVNTVIPYFQRFMQRFPDVASLANAAEDDVLHHWAGLGYYSRARNLHRTAKVIMQEHAGQFPQNTDALITLPGIGLSTAGAIMAIAYNQSVAILDGNVKRVLTRLHGITDIINTSTTEKRLWSLAQQYTPKKRVADYTQAMMDLGATLCTRSKPQCDACPFVRDCVAHQEDMVSLLPKKKASKTLPVRIATMLMIRHGQQFLLCKRPSSGIWGGLWSFPEIEGKPQQQLIRTYIQEKFHTTYADCHVLPSFRHTFSHYHVDIYPVNIVLHRKPSKTIEETQQIWYNLHQPEAIGLPKPVQTLMKAFTYDTPRTMRKTKQTSRRVSTSAAAR